MPRHPSWPTQKHPERPHFGSDRILFLKTQVVAVRIVKGFVVPDCSNW